MSIDKAWAAVEALVPMDAALFLWSDPAKGRFGAQVRFRDHSRRGMTTGAGGATAVAALLALAAKLGTREEVR